MMNRAPSTAHELVHWLPARLVRVLAGLDGASPRVAEAAVQLLPFGSRAALESCGLAIGRDIGELRLLTLTPFAFQVMSAAALASSELSEDSLESLEAEARAATRDLAADS